ncbi:hypothetical protein SVIOM342S_04202 [Streptomyces violaceorubidus]
MTRGLLTGAGEIRAAVDAFGDIGADEVVLYCWSSDLDPGRPPRRRRVLTVLAAVAAQPSPRSSAGRAVPIGSRTTSSARSS